MFSHIYHPIALALNIIKYVLNSLHVYLLLIMKIIAKITVRKFYFFHKMILREITCLNSILLTKSLA